jgi:antitoxin (DNA-binding transcriptional repressor) of toxin-antitoxin stability system
MTQVTVEEAYGRLGSLIDAAVKGEEIVLVDGEHGAVRLVPVIEVSADGRPPLSRPSEWFKGKWSLPDSFFEPLPDDFLDLFAGAGAH